MSPRIEFTVPVRIDSSLSLNGRLHWAVRKRKTDAVKRAVMLTARTTRAATPRLPAVVTLARISPRRMDDDNSVSALKGVRDTVALLLGIDDGDPRVSWRYAQETGPWGVRVAIEEVTP